ncbi:hypothetical protein PBRA_005048 [Plasmodiophora brassicae]|uniref:Uncharacterized protein n=1 Tax=Plasmodiophora brassicae TaxID=37360 RepID=A0A0G4IMQ0_PLABS|nr:hypothetical protein PBRA_005048 [Plasmodiophora brassicae]
MGERRSDAPRQLHVPVSWPAGRSSSDARPSPDACRCTATPRSSRASHRRRRPASVSTWPALGRRRVRPARAFQAITLHAPLMAIRWRRFVVDSGRRTSCHDAPHRPPRYLADAADNVLVLVAPVVRGIVHPDRVLRPHHVSVA